MKNYKYHPYIDDYIEKVNDGTYKTSKWVKKLIAYVEGKLNDPERKVIIDEEEITEAKEFIERYYPFQLYPAQLFILAFVVGVFYEDESLVFNEFLLLWGRGAGKNGFIATLATWLIEKQGIERYNVDIVALSEEQAKTSFMDVHDMLSKFEKKMKKFFKWTLKVIMAKRSRSKISYYTNNAKTKDGLRPGAVVFDEIHEYDSYDNIKVFTSAQGKVPNPRTFYLTTDGYLRNGVLDDLKEEAMRILDGEIKNTRMFPFLAMLDDVEEVHDVENWEKANPGINYLPHLKKEMLEEYEKMEYRPSVKVEFMTKRMNMPRMIQYNSVADPDKIKAARLKPLPDLTGHECVVGIDYSDIRDFASIGLLFKVGDMRYWKQHTFINRASLRMHDYKVDIDMAVDKGLVTIIEDEVNDPTYLADWLIEQSKIYSIKGLAGDLFRINYLRETFESYGFPKIEIARSGTRTDTQQEPIIDEMFAKEKIAWGDDNLMVWYTSNIYIKRDGKGNITYEKIDPQLRKTDGFSALRHAMQYEQLIKNTNTITKENVKRAFRSFSF